VNCHRSYWCINGVNDTGNACFAFVNDTGEDMPVSLTPANTCFAGVNDTGEEFFAGVVDTSEAL
jgi:hypothetical protein